MITPDALEQLRIAMVTGTNADIGPTDAKDIIDLVTAVQKWRRDQGQAARSSYLTAKEIRNVGDAEMLGAANRLLARD